MIGGHTAFGHGGYNYTDIDKIIPVAMENETGEGNQPFRMMITAEGLTHPIMSLGATPEETERIWRDKNPRLYGYDLVDRPKPGAVVLAVDPSNGNRNGAFVILAAQEVGNGRSLAYTSDTTRYWGKDFETIWGEPLDPNQPISERNCDSIYFRKFWNNAIRWLSAKRLARKNVTFTVETAKRRVNAGEIFPVHVQWKAAVAEGQTPARPPDLVHFRIVDLATNEVVQTADSPLHPDTNSYEGRFTLPKSGRYLIDLDGANERTSTCTPAIVTCDTTDPELADTRADSALMSEIARVSGGQVLSETSTDELRTASQRNSTSGHMEYEPESLWDQGWVLAVLAGLLITEWVLRRLWSLI